MLLTMLVCTPVYIDVFAAGTMGKYIKALRSFLKFYERSLQKDGYTCGKIR